MTDVCRICGKPEVTDEEVDKYDYRNDRCWRVEIGWCRDEQGKDIKDEVGYVCNQRDKLIEENKRLQLMLEQILGESVYTPKPSEMDRLEEAKAYVKGINDLRRKTIPPR